MDKVMSIEKAIEPIKDGMTIMIGGFGGIGSPHTVIDAICKKGVKDLTVICNDPGTPNFGNGRFIHEKRIKKLIAAFTSCNREFQVLYKNNEIEIELVPMGTLVEAIRAGGFGLGGVLTKTGLGTLVEEGKQKVVVKGETYLLQEPLKADVSLIYANRADRMGNLVYHGNSRSHTTAMATAADYVICEVAKIVEIGEIPPNSVHTPAVFVNAVVQKEEK